MVTFILIDILVLMAITALVASTYILVLFKYKAFTLYEVNRPKWAPKICYLCITFWICLGVIIALNWYFRTKGLDVLDILIIAAGATALARRITADIPTA